jgi:transcription elongation factor GreB
MSRAFTKEQDGPEVVEWSEPEVIPGVPNRITPFGAAALRGRLERARAERKALGESARDTSRRAELDPELRFLERRVGSFVETPLPVAPAKAGFGVAVTMSRDDRTRVITIGGVDEVDAERGWVSFTSPVAKALFGAEPGDLVVVPTPRGEEEWEVEAVAPAVRPG